MISNDAKRVLLEKHRAQVERRHVANKTIAEKLNLSDEQFLQCHHELETLGFLRLVDRETHGLPYPMYDQLTDGGMTFAEHSASAEA